MIIQQRDKDGCHSRENGNPLLRNDKWIPACAGMTFFFGVNLSREIVPINQDRLISLDELSGYGTLRRDEYREVVEKDAADARIVVIKGKETSQANLIVSVFSVTSLFTR